MKTYIDYAFKYLNTIVCVLIIMTLFNIRGNIKNIDEPEIIIKTSSEVILPSTPRIIEADKELVNVDKQDEIILDVFYANISHYGPDCIGCIGITASGYDVRNNNIYYNDKEYGKVKIVAADRTMKFGTIVRMNIDNEPVLAIVLDRGGAIGFNKKFQFDLLCESEKTSYELGIEMNSKIEVLRIGY